MHYGMCVHGGGAWPTRPPPPRSASAPLSRSGLVDKVRQYLHQGGVDPTHYSGHSFCIGAATTAAAKGVSDATIQVLGRWASDSYTRYIRVPRQELSSF